MANTTIDNGQTCLEKRGYSARQEHLQRNRWYYNYEYTKQMIEDEYDAYNKAMNTVTQIY